MQQKGENMTKLIAFILFIVIVIAANIGIGFVPVSGGKKSKRRFRLILDVICIALAAVFVSTDCTYSIGEQEEAVVTTFGSPVAVTEKGLHFKLPFIQEVRKVDTTIKGFAMGYNEDSDETVDEEGVMITSDFNFIDIGFYIEYKASDPVRWLYASDDPVLILKNIAQSCIRNVIGESSVDDVLTTGKAQIQASIRDEIVKQLELQDLGVQLVNITIQDAEPPTTEVMAAFKAVESAKQGKETSINSANAYKNEQIPAAEAQADKILQEAELTKAQRINEANEAVAMFEAMYQEYTKNPEITRTRMFYETMEDILPNMKVIINTGESSSINTILPLDTLIDQKSSSGVSSGNANSAKEDK